VRTSAGGCIVNAVLQSDSADALIIPFDAVRKDDISLAGGKGANLGELTGAGIAVPPGYVITASAYDDFFRTARLHEETAGLLTDVKDSAIADVASKMRALIGGADMPDHLASGIVAAYQQMGGGPVAVRSSATAEDLPEASFAGQQETYLNIEGETEVLRAVQRCWASLFEERAVHYRATAGLGQVDAKMAVVVQRMVQADRSGVMFTVNPVSGNEGQMVIEAVYGLGEGIVSGVLTPDMYVVEKASVIVLDCQVAPQEQELVRCREGYSCAELNHWEPVDWGRRARQKLSAEVIAELAALGKRLEDHFGRPQDIEWAIEGQQIYIVQSRPVTAVLS
jgi:pyruvate, water dikinase